MSDVLVGNHSIAGVSSPRAVDEAGNLIGTEEFQAWLESRVGPLKDLLSPLASGAGLDGDFGKLIDATVIACRGAYAFDSLDWRHRLREQDQRFKAELPALRASLDNLIEKLPSYGIRLKSVTDWVVRAAQHRYGSELKLPFPADLTFVEILSLLSDALATADQRLRQEMLPHMTRHGCLDYQRPIQGNKVRDRRQMLAFNLVFLFRAASAGPWALTGPMPEDGMPCYPQAAALVSATLNESPEDPITKVWVRSSVRSILTNNASVLVVPWPSGMDDIETATWSAPPLIVD